MTKERAIRILMADDDVDDRMMAAEAKAENKVANQLNFVENGEELLGYLRHQGEYNRHNAPKPDIILLDINMPKMNGIEALQEIKSDGKLRSIPVVMLTTNRAEEYIVKSYHFGVNSFVNKPVTFDQLVNV